MHDATPKSHQEPAGSRTKENVDYDECVCVKREFHEIKFKESSLPQSM